MKRIFFIILTILLVSAFGGCFGHSSNSDKAIIVTDKYNVSEGESIQLGTLLDEEEVDSNRIEWISSNEEVATVDSKGLVRGVTQGSTLITLSVDGKASSVSITVDESNSKTLYSSIGGLVYNNLTVWDGNGSLETDLSLDGYGKVIKVDIGSSTWMSLVFNNLGSNVFDDYSRVSFKIKPVGITELKLYSLGLERQVSIYEGKALSKGWYQMAVDFSSFSSGSINGDGQIGFIHAVAGTQYYITDIVLEKAATTEEIEGTDIYSADSGVNSGAAVDNWGSGSTLTELSSYNGYGKVYRVEAGSGWGAPSACIAFMNIGDYQKEYSKVTFKVKSDNLNSIYVKVPEVEKDYAINGGTNLGNGWHQVTVPFSDYSGTVAGATQIGIHGGYSRGGTFYITDVRLVNGNGSTDDGIGEYKLVWKDEFDQGILDMSKWNYETGYGSWGWGNDEWQLYTSNSKNIKVQNGSLVITARQEEGKAIGKRNGSITSGKITTQGKFSFEHGKIQARIKVPDGKTMWPAFWMLGDSISSVGWPACGEIDILEMFNKDSNPADNYTAHSALHWNNYGHQYVTSHLTTGSKLSSAYHVYELEWTSNKIITRIDGQQIFSSNVSDSAMSEFHDNFYLILNLAVGGNPINIEPKAEYLPQSMYVDWIRVYQK